MNWAVAVTTAPRPVATLEKTLASLRRAGWDRCEVVEDTHRAGAWPTWRRALRRLIECHPRADALLISQDDALFCRGLREYLERTLWPGDRVALCSPYCPAVYRSQKRGWHREDRGWLLIGAVCWALPHSAAEAILEDLGRLKAQKHIDAHVGRWAQETGRSVWYHMPSLVQHAADDNSTLGYASDPRLRMASDFIGEEVRP